MADNDAKNKVEVKLWKPQKAFVFRWKDYVWWKPERTNKKFRKLTNVDGRTARCKNYIQKSTMPPLNKQNLNKNMYKIYIKKQTCSEVNNQRTK